MTELTVKQVAARLGVTDRTVRNMIARGDLPGAHQLPGGPSLPYLIPVEDVEEYERKRQEPRK